MSNFDGTDDYFDSREVIERIAELTAAFIDATGDDPADVMSADDWAFGLGEDEGQELADLIAFRDEADHLPDWEYGETFISDGYFTDYAEETVEECGCIPADLPVWLANAIDWDKVADALKEDYMEFEFRGATYWARA